MNNILVAIAWCTTAIAFINGSLFLYLYLLLRRAGGEQKLSFLNVLTLCIALNQFWFSGCRLAIMTGIIKGNAAQAYFSPAFFLITVFGIYLTYKFWEQ